MQSVEILVPLGFFAMVLAIVYLGIRKKERMALIEKGADASTFVKKSSGNSSLKWGLLLVGVALGMLIGNWLAETSSFQGEEEVAYFSMVFLFGGIALVVNYFLNKRERDNEKNKDITKTL